MLGWVWVGFGAGNYLFGSAGGSLAGYVVVNRYFFTRQVLVHGGFGLRW